MKKNIQFGFRKAGLVLFNPVVALSQLPSAPPIPPRAVIPVPHNTPKNLQQFKNVLDNLETFFIKESA